MGFIAYKHGYLREEKEDVIISTLDLDAILISVLYRHQTMCSESSDFNWFWKYTSISRERTAVNINWYIMTDFHVETPF